MKRQFLSLQKFLKKINVHLIATIKVLLFSKWGIKTPQKRNSDLIIVGNGPSLEEDLQSIDKDSNYDYLAVNFMALSDKFYELKPYCYALCDPVFFEPSKKDELHDKIILLFQTLYNKCTWETQLFLPYESRKGFKDKIGKLELKNPNIKVNYYNKTNFNGKSNLIQWFYKSKLGMPNPTTVLIPCLFIGMWMEYKSIGLTGAGHNFHEQIKIGEHNTLLIKQTHFYEEEVKYVPFYKTNRVDVYTISEFFLVLHKMFGSYEFVSKFAHSLGIQLVNYTKDSYIDQIDKK